MEEREFSFDEGEVPYGFVCVGAKICEVVPFSLAEEVGVQPGWYIAKVDGEELPGAMQNLCRKIPAATTEEVHELLHRKREHAILRGITLIPDATASASQSRSTRAAVRSVVEFKAPVEREAPVVKIVFWTDPQPHKDNSKPPPAYEAQSIEELKEILINTYGSLVAAWHQALDTDGSGHLDYQEFLDACRKVGFEGSLKKVYRELDLDGTGSISLTELDPTCQMDFGKGTCFICQLPNPCIKHSEKEQRDFTLKERKRLMSSKRRVFDPFTG